MSQCFFYHHYFIYHQSETLVYRFSLFHLTEADRQRVSVSKQSDNEMTAELVVKDNTEPLEGGSRLKVRRELFLDKQRFLT